MEVNQIFGYPKLRRANIPPDERDVFDRTGEAGVQLALMGSFHPKSELATILNNEPLAKHAQEWLTERADIRARHEWRMECLEWAILIFLIVGVFADFLLAFHWFDPR
jgi:hypothetical protein